MTSLYEPRPVKRVRSTNAQLAEVDAAIVAAVEADAPVTLRGVFYRVVSTGAIPKTEKAYDLVKRELLKLRRDGTVPYADITDGSRWTFKPETWTSVDQMLEDASESYRRALWHDQPVHVEILSEKDAITGAISGVCDEWDVPLGIVRGYSSETFVWQTARELERQIDAGKHCYLYQLGDHDPSGVDAWRAFQERITEFLDHWYCSPDVRVTFERLAVTPEQIDSMGLLTRPTKSSDTRSANFHGESVEVDAIPANTLRRIVRDAIEQHIPREALELERRIEQSEREGLRDLMGLVG
jgi:hypothetical protein